MRALIVSGYGINADEELGHAFTMAGAQAQLVHAADLIAKPGLLAGAGFLAFPGGFSFGDHLGSALVLANMFRSSMEKDIRSFIADGGMVIGICNGFQVLVKMGLLPDLDGQGKAEASLVHNDCGHYLDEWVDVRFEHDSPCVWTKGLSPRLLPIRHGEGKFVCTNADTLKRLEKEHRVALRYDGRNPNGSVNDIAGICDATGRVFGLMPHPEASIHPEAHPYRRRGIRGGLGLDLFQNAVAWRSKAVSSTS